VYIDILLHICISLLNYLNTAQSVQSNLAKLFYYIEIIKNLSNKN